MWEMKQTSWLSGLSAVRMPSSTARARTSSLVISPIGSITRSSWGPVSMWIT